MKNTLAVSAIAHAVFLSVVIVPGFRSEHMKSVDIIKVSLVVSTESKTGAEATVSPPVEDNARKAEPEAPKPKMTYKPSKKAKDTKAAEKKSKTPKPAPAKPQAPAKTGTGRAGDGRPGSGAGSNVKVDEGDFQFAYYLEVIRERISANWSPPPVYGSDGQVMTTVYFKISRDGRISDEKVEAASKFDLFDKAALRAIRLSGPLPPLPAGFRGRSLGVHFEFQHNPG